MFSGIIYGISVCAEVAHFPGPRDSEEVSCCYKVVYGWFHYYPTLGVRTMADREEQSLKETKRKEKRLEEEAERLAKEQVRRKDTLAREQAIEEDQKERETKRKEKRAAEEIRQSARDRARRKDTLTRERAIEEEQKAKKTKQSEERAAEETERLAKDQARRKDTLTRDQARRKDTLTREQAIAEAQEAKKLKAKNNPQSEPNGYGQGDEQGLGLFIEFLS